MNVCDDHMLSWLDVFLRQLLAFEFKPIVTIWISIFELMVCNNAEIANYLFSIGLTWHIVNLVKAQIWQVSFFFLSIFLSWGFPVPKGQLEWVSQSLKPRMSCLKSTFFHYFIMDVIMLVGYVFQSWPVGAALGSALSLLLIQNVLKRWLAPLC